MKQQIFECYIDRGSHSDIQKLRKLLVDGWLVITAIPLIRDGNTFQINYVLQKENDNE